jgi:hypothetical protein
MAYEDSYPPRMRTIRLSVKKWHSFSGVLPIALGWYRNRSVSLINMRLVLLCRSTLEAAMPFLP